MASHLSTSTASNGPSTSDSSTTNSSTFTPAPSLSALPRSHTFTSRLPSDPLFPTPSVSHTSPRGDLLPRQVRGGALYTYVRPTAFPEPELLAVSPAALRDLGISEAAAGGDEFLQVLSGNRILGWEDMQDGGEGTESAAIGRPHSAFTEAANASSEEREKLAREADEQQQDGKIYPWAQCYGGFQFGNWAGQLGDGRAHSLFEITHPVTKKRYELQLKGGGRTPYSRFADGRAVLRSSIREFVVSEALNALGIRSTRALSLVLSKETSVLRERKEMGAIVGRFAESWLRFGTFDLLRARGDRENTRRLAEYLAEEVYGGWDKLAAALPEKGESATTEGSTVKFDSDSNAYAHLTSSQLLEAPGGVPPSTIEGADASAQNRFTRLYRSIARANARTVAHWQLYGFTNGVLNTDNTSLLGLSLDFGPFSFIDVYDPSFTPNHDDHTLRYSYANQPSVVWWNLTRLGEALGELLGAGPLVDEERFIKDGFQESDIEEAQKRAETAIMRAGDEYKAVLRAEFSNGMAKRLGLKRVAASDYDALYSPWLDALEEGELDFNHSFRRLGSVTLAELRDAEGRLRATERFFTADAKPLVGLEEAKKKLAAWLETYGKRVAEDWGENSVQADEERKRAMDGVNPKFVPRNWILDEVIQRVEKGGEREILQRVLAMALEPFKEEWGWDKAEEERFCGDVPKYKAGIQCSCSS